MMEGASLLLQPSAQTPLEQQHGFRKLSSENALDAFLPWTRCKQHIYPRYIVSISYGIFYCVRMMLRTLPCPAWEGLPCNLHKKQ